MINTIENLYSLQLTLVSKQPTYWILKDKEYFYYCVDTLHANNYLEEWSQVIKYPYHRLLKTKDNQIIFRSKDKQYCLLRIETLLDDTITLKELTTVHPVFKEPLDWKLIWKERLQSLEMYLHQNKTPLWLETSYAYFSSLIENLISLLQETPNAKISSIAHKRITIPIKPIDFYNPLNLVVDSPIRDIASYITESFWNHTYEEKEISFLLNQISKEEHSLFMIRLLYPYFYLDALEIYERSGEENKLKEIIAHIEEWNYFLKGIEKRLTGSLLFTNML